MNGFTPQYPVVRDLLNGKWELVEPIQYVANDGRFWIIPAGFLTDFGSVPDLVDWIIPQNSTVADPCYALHDYHYACNRAGEPVTHSREDADDILYEALLQCGVSVVKAKIIWAAVRVAGSFAWRG